MQVEARTETWSKVSPCPIYMHYRRFITFIYCHAITALVGTTDKPVKHCQHRQSPGKVNVAAAPPARQSERFIRESGMGYMTRPSGLILRFTNKVVHGSEAFPFSGTHNCVIFCGDCTDGLRTFGRTGGAQSFSLSWSE